MKGSAPATLAGLGTEFDRCLAIPEGLEGFADAQNVMRHGEAAIYHKLIRADALGVEFSTTAPCLCHVLNGRETFTAADGEEIVVGTGELILLPRGIHMISDFVAADGPLEAFLFFFDLGTVAEFERQGCGPGRTRAGGVGAYKITADSSLMGYMRALGAVYRGLDGTRALLRTKLLELLLLIAALDDPRRLQAFLRENSAEAGRRNIKHLLREYRGHNLSVQDYARLSGRSVSAFTRAFKQQFGMPPSQWLIEQRLLRAQEALLNTNDTVTEIGLDAGYRNTSHFIARFKTRFGATPSAVRRRGGPEASSRVAPAP